VLFWLRQPPWASLSSFFLIFLQRRLRRTPSVDPSPDPTVDVDAPEVTGEPVSRQELNSWRRGFTPQAEIWNGRLAMVGLSVGLTVLLVARLAAHHP